MKITNIKKKIVQASVIKCNEITNIASNIPTNVRSTASINCDSKKVRYKIDYCILRPILLAIFLLFSISFIYVIIQINLGKNVLRK